MLITQERETASTSSNSKRIPVNLPDTLNKGQEAAKNDNTHRCHTDHTTTQASTMNSCATNMGCLRLVGKSISPRLRQKYAPSFGPVVSPTSPTTKFIKRSLFISKEDDDNDVFHSAAAAHSISSNNNNNNIIINSNNNNCNTSSSLSPLSSSPPAPSSGMTSDAEKQEVLAGRLYLIRQIGNASQSSASPSSPSRSFTKPFNFASIGLSSPPSSPPSHNTSPIAKRKLPVYVRVYKCHKDHFALISRDSSYSSRQIYLNMRHCRVFPGDSIGRFIVAGNSDSGSLMEFETSDLSSLDGWLDALQTQTIPESPMRSFSSNSSGCGGSGGGVGGAGGKSSSNNSAGSPSIPKSSALPTLTEADDEEDRSG